MPFFSHWAPARDLWTFLLLGLKDRLEDLAPNLDFDLEQFARRNGVNVRFNREARERFLRFATSLEATWPGNFRSLNGAVVRMATLARGGRITTEIADEEIARLRAEWRSQYVTRSTTRSSAASARRAWPRSIPSTACNSSTWSTSEDQTKLITGHDLILEVFTHPEAIAFW